MKKTFLALTLVAFASTSLFAQKKLTPVTKSEKSVEVKTANAVADPAISAKAEEVAANTTIKFTKGETHDFGTLQEGDAAEAEFEFKNTGKEPLIIQNVHPSCGCTVPSWSKEAVAPGKKGVIKASYGTKGRVGAFNKNITVTSTAGTTTLWIKGNVEKAPEASAPANTSMMKSK